MAWNRRTKGMEFVASLLVKGVAPDNREYDLFGFGTWITEEKIDPSGLFERSTMTRRAVRSYWQWANRGDRMPKTLKVALAPNPEYFRWILLADVYKFLCSRLNLDKALIERSLILAFRNHVRTICAGSTSSRLPNGRISTTAHDIRIHTKDLIRWLDLEYDLKVRLSDLFVEDDGTPPLFKIIWPKLDEDWPELDGEGDLKGQTKLY